MDFWKPLSKLRAIFGYIHTCPPPNILAALWGSNLVISICTVPHTRLYFLFFLSCRREARRYHGAAIHCGWIYRLKVCATVCVCFSGAGPSLPSAWVFHLQPSQKMHCILWADRGGPPTPCTLLTAGLTSTRVHFFCFLPLVLFWCLNGRGVSRQLGHFHVDHDAGGDEYNGLRGDAFQSLTCHCVASTLVSGCV